MKKGHYIILLAVHFFITACNQAVTANREINQYAQSNEVAESNLRLGSEYLKIGNYEKALEKLNRSLEADRNYPPTYNALGILHQQIGQMEKAEEYFKTSLRLNSSSSVTLNNYGFFLCKSGRYDEAEDAFLTAAKNPLYESPEIAYSNAGACCLQQNKKENAEQYFRKALDLNPKIPVALLKMSELTYEQENYLSARGYLQRYLEIANHSPTSLWLGIRIERELGDKNALASYSLLLKNNFPDSPEAHLLKGTGARHP